MSQPVDVLLYSPCASWHVPMRPMEPVPSAHRLLIVDDDRAFREALASAFVRRGYTVKLAESPDDALAAVGDFEPTRALIDLRMPRGSGLDLVRELKQRFPDAAVVVLTGYGSIPTAIEAVKRGALNYLTKPAEPGEIEAAFQDATDGHEAPSPTEVSVPSLDRATWEHMQRVLSECQGNISEAARRLGMHRRTLQRKLQKHPPRR